MQNLAKKIKKFLFKIFLLSRANRKYIRLSGVSESIVSADPEKLFVVVVAFNEPELIALHVAALKKFLKNPYEYFVIDNSNREDRAEAIRHYCLANKINYVRLPVNPGLDGSLSHGLALNWVYRNIIQRFKPRLFGFMDHDLYPIDEVDIVSYLNRADAWGFITTQQPFWHFWNPHLACWSGLAFYRLERFAAEQPNFLPTWGFDTVGGVRVEINRTSQLPDPNIYTYTPLEVAPGVFVRQKGKFVHFVGASYNPHSLEEQKQWMENILKK